MLAILNSDLMSVLYGAYFGALIMSGGYFQFQAPQLRVLPIRQVSFDTPSVERRNLLERSKELCADLMDNPEDNRLYDLIRQQLATTPSHADVVHDLLAFLARDMIEMNKEKQSEINLTHKTTIRSYHEQPFSALLAALRTNRRRFGPGFDVSGRRFQEELDREFNASVQKLLPLKASIETTDNLIDEIVFRLYGLTDDEINLVKDQSDADS